MRKSQYTDNYTDKKDAAGREMSHVFHEKKKNMENNIEKTMSV